jgi:hypothetical protein
VSAAEDSQSAWLREATPLTHEAPSREARVAAIGGGGAGVSTALHLARGTATTAATRMAEERRLEQEQVARP